MYNFVFVKKEKKKLFFFRFNFYKKKIRSNLSIKILFGKNENEKLLCRFCEQNRSPCEYPSGLLRKFVHAIRFRENLYRETYSLHENISLEISFLLVEGEGRGGGGRVILFDRVRKIANWYMGNINKPLHKCR